MKFQIRLQREPALTTPQALRNDVDLQKVSAAVKSCYMKKQVPTTAQDVKAEIELTYPSVTLGNATGYGLYRDPVTGEMYYCCDMVETLTVAIPGGDPVVVELIKSELVP